MTHPKKDQYNQFQTQLARYAKALSHPARVSILETLAERKSCICGEIVEVLPLAQSTVSQHLRELKDAGMIRGEIEGQKSCYCIDDKAIAEFEKLAGNLLKLLGKKFNFNKCC